MRRSQGWRSWRSESLRRGERPWRSYSRSARLTAAVSLIGCLSLGGCTGGAADSAVRAGPLGGTWQIVAFEDDAKDRLERLGAGVSKEGTERPPAKLVFTLTDCYVLRGNGKRERKPGLANAAFAGYTLALDAHPTAIDLVGVKDDTTGFGKIYPGIFQLEGKTLTLCYNEEGPVRPTQFVSNEQWNLMVCKQISPTPEVEDESE